MQTIVLVFLLYPVVNLHILENEKNPTRVLFCFLVIVIDSNGHIYIFKNF